MPRERKNPTPVIGKRPEGRPPTVFNMDYCEKLVEHMAQGLSFQTFGATLNPIVCKEVLNQWVIEFPEFAAAKSRGLAAGELWYERLCSTASLGLIEKGATDRVWLGKNRYGWKDKQEIEQVVTQRTETVEEYLKRLDDEAKK